MTTYVCDFCAGPAPVTVWHTPEGQRTEVFGLQDSDGRWAACQSCHDGVLNFRKHQARPSAIRHFVKRAWKSFMNHAQSQTSGLEKVKNSLPGRRIRDQQEILFKKLLPNLQDFITFDEAEALREDLLARQQAAAGAPADSYPKAIPDGQTRGRRVM